MKCQDIVERLEELSPQKYACDWDNVGLLVGRKERDVKRILVALDATKEVVEYAVNQNMDMLITHHPMIFSSVRQVNEEDFTSEKILTLAENRICYYAMHTNFDAVGGMAELAAGKEYMNLRDTKPIDICECCVEQGNEMEGMGRYGILPKPMTGEEAAQYVKERFHLDFVMLYQSEAEDQRIFERIAIMPGAGKSEMQAVKRQGYDLYLTGDFGHHGGMDAMDMGMTIIDATHYGLEHIFMEYMVNYLRENLDSEIYVEAMKQECPVKII